MPVLVMCAASVLVLGAWLVLADGSSPENGRDQAQLTPTSAPVDPPQPSQTGEEAGDGIRSPDQPLIDVALNAVVVSPRGEGARLVSIDQDGSETVTDLPPLTRFQFDPSGNWVAGVGVGRLGERNLTLWAGPVHGPMEPIAVGVRAFAWHDDDDGRLGWTGGNRDRVTTLTLDTHDSTEELPLPTEGRLTGWGDWGYAIETSPRELATAVVGLDGELLVHVAGRYRGRLPGDGTGGAGELIFSGGAAPPLRYLLDTSEVAPVPWLDDADDIWSLAVVAETDAVVAVVARGGNLKSPVDGEVVVINAAGSATVRDLDGLTPLGLSDEGGILFVDQQPGSAFGPGAFTVINARAVGSPNGRSDGATPGTAESVAAPVPDVFEGPEWVVALAVT